MRAVFNIDTSHVDWYSQPIILLEYQKSNQLHEYQMTNYCSLLESIYKVSGQEVLAVTSKSNNRSLVFEGVFVFFLKANSGWKNVFLWLKILCLEFTKIPKSEKN